MPIHCTCATCVRHAHIARKHHYIQQARAEHESAQFEAALRRHCKALAVCTCSATISHWASRTMAAYGYVPASRPLENCHCEGCAVWDELEMPPCACDEVASLSGGGRLEAVYYLPCPEEGVESTYPVARVALFDE